MASTARMRAECPSRLSQLKNEIFTTTAPSQSHARPVQRKRSSTLRAFAQARKEPALVSGHSRETAPETRRVLTGRRRQRERRGIGSLADRTPSESAVRQPTEPVVSWCRTESCRLGQRVDSFRLDRESERPRLARSRARSCCRCFDQLPPRPTAIPATTVTPLRAHIRTWLVGGHRVASSAQSNSLWRHLSVAT